MLGLHHGLPREISSAKPSWKFKIVLDAGPHARLAAGSFTLDHHGMQAFGGSMDGSS
jgi:hypothetical protein